MAIKITITTPQQAAQALHHVWPGSEQERRALVQMIIERVNVGALLNILPMLGPRQAEEAIKQSLPRIRIDEAFLALRELRPCEKYRRSRSLLIRKVLRNPIRRWLHDIESFQDEPELRILFLTEEIDEMVAVVERSRSPEFAFKLRTIASTEGRSLLNQEQRERLKRLADQYKHFYQ